MRILMVLANDTFPPDPRVSKEASVLVRAGHEIVLLALAGEGQDAEERVGDVDVVRFRPQVGSTFRRKLDSLAYLTSLASPAWTRRIVELGRERDVDAVHVHDLPQARAAMLAARRLGVPFVLDLHENYPHALRVYRRRTIDRAFVPPDRMARLERRLVRRADRTIVVIEEARDRLVDGGADAERIIVFGNVEPRPAGTYPARTPGEGFEIVYFGKVDGHRGLDTVVAAMPRVLELVSDASLTVIGDGSTLPQLREQAHALGLGSRIRFTGWMEATEAMETVAGASIGVVPHHRSPHTDATIPHKVFQYMSLGIPVIVSDCVPLERLVRSTGAGAVFTAGDPEDFAEVVATLSDTMAASKAGMAGFDAVRGEWSLEAHGERLVAAYPRASNPADERP